MRKLLLKAISSDDSFAKNVFSLLVLKLWYRELMDNLSAPNGTSMMKLIPEAMAHA
jgi:hypothetical protein